MVSAWLAPILFIGGTTAAGLAWPAYSPVHQTISELAAGDAPTRAFMTAIFALTALCHAVTGTFATGIGVPGRVTLLVASIALFSVAAHPLPTVAGTSVDHTVSAMIGFVLLAAWPLLGIRTVGSMPSAVRSRGGITGTLLLTALCVVFLVVWAGHDSGSLGVVERAAAYAETVWPTLIVSALFIAARRQSAVV